MDGESNVLGLGSLPLFGGGQNLFRRRPNHRLAPSAVAMTTGVKTINDLMGLNHTATLNNCEDQQTKAVTTLWEMAATLGMATGAVTTATITHATPGATYAHIANRDWESDAKMPADAPGRRLPRHRAPAGGNEIRQRPERGDGRWARQLLPDSVSDPEYPSKTGRQKGWSRPDAGLAAALRRAWAIRMESRHSSIKSSRVRSTICWPCSEPSHMNFEHDRR